MQLAGEAKLRGGAAKGKWEGAGKGSGLQVYILIASSSQSCCHGKQASARGKWESGGHHIDLACNSWTGVEQDTI